MILTTKMTSENPTMDNIDFTAINDLITDMCQFLNVSLESEDLSEGTQQERKELSQRGYKILLTLPADSFSPSPSPTPSYLDMQGTNNKIDDVDATYVDATSAKPNDDNLSLIYDAISLTVSSSAEVTEPEKCPYEDLSVSEMRMKASKEGPLWRKERKFFMDQLKQIYGGLMGSWLLFYQTPDKDLKPMQCIDIREYEVKIQTNPTIKDCKRKSCCYELFRDDDKPIQLFARTMKDMEQWVTELNKSAKQVESNSPVIMNSPRRLPTPPPTPPTPTTPDIDPYYVDCGQNLNGYEDDNIYECPNFPSTQTKSEKSKLSEDQMKLPPRRPILHSTSKQKLIPDEELYDDIGNYQNNSTIQKVKPSTKGPKLPPKNGTCKNDPPEYDTPKTAVKIEATVDQTLNYDTPKTTPVKVKQAEVEEVTPPKSTAWSRLTSYSKSAEKKPTLSAKPKIELDNDRSKLFRGKKLGFKNTVFDNENTNKSKVSTEKPKDTFVKTSPFKMASDSQPRTMSMKGSKIHDIIQKMEANGGVKFQQQLSKKSGSVSSECQNDDQFYEPINNS